MITFEDGIKKTAGERIRLKPKPNLVKEKIKKRKEYMKNNKEQIRLNDKKGNKKV